MSLSVTRASNASAASRQTENALWSRPSTAARYSSAVRSDGGKQCPDEPEHSPNKSQPNKSQRMLGSNSTPTPTFARWTRNVDATFGFSMLNLAEGRDANVRLPHCKWLCLVDVLRVKACGRAPCEDLWKCARDNSLQCVRAITVIDVARGSGQCLASSAYSQTSV